MSESTSDYQSQRIGGSGGVMVKLSIMMFIQFFIWGAWYVTMSNFMTATNMTGRIGIAYMLSPIAAIISPFFLGMVADRFFASEKVLALLHLLGAVAMFLVPTAARNGPAMFLAVVWIHTLFYMPTINLTNSIAFASMTNQEKQFPLVRVFGTLGWIAANLVVSLMKVDTEATQFMIAGVAGVVLAVFSLVLPHTPPPLRGTKSTVGQILGVDALSLMKNRSFAVFALCSFLIAIPLAAYYSFASRMVGDILAVKLGRTTGLPIAATMSVGQAAEVVFMLILPFFFARLGVKWMLAVGMLSWVLRYVLFAVGAPPAALWIVMIGVALHGLCYDFFFVTGFIYTDKRAPKEIRGQAQGLNVLLTYGLGLGIGGYLSGEWFNRVVGAAVRGDALPLYQRFWMTPAIFAGVVLLIFVLLFRDDSKEPPIEIRRGE